MMMKKLKSTLILLSVAGVITALTVTVGNTLTTRTQRELALRTNNSLLTKPTPIPVPTPQKTPKPIPSPTITPAPTATPAPSPTPVNLILPAVGAEVVEEYTEDVLVFQETYGDYRTHLGIDFAKEKNTPVCAVADGIVTQNYFDYEHGYTIAIEHNDQLTSIYKNLSGDKMVQVGQVLKQGTVIGGMGDSGISESHLAHHLHFELHRDGIPVNPTTYFSEALSRAE